MRRLLGVLHAGEDGRARAAADAARARRARRARARRRAAGRAAPSTASARPLPAGLDLAAYRIVQEALTNAHQARAARAPTEVHVRWATRRSSCEVAIADRGAGAPSGAGGGGHGLVGMRERVRAVRRRAARRAGAPAAASRSARGSRSWPSSARWSSRMSPMRAPDRRRPGAGARRLPDDPRRRGRHRRRRRGRRRRRRRSTLARRLKPDVVLMDIRMPELDGIEATRRVARRRRRAARCGC